MQDNGHYHCKIKNVRVSSLNPDIYVETTPKKVSLLVSADNTSQKNNLQLQVYPNPTKETAYISSKAFIGNKSKLNLLLTDSNGRATSVSYQTINEETIKLKLPEANGTYYLKIEKQGKIIGTGTIIVSE